MAISEITRSASTVTHNRIATATPTPPPKDKYRRLDNINEMSMYTCDTHNWQKEQAAIVTNKNQLLVRTLTLHPKNICTMAAIIDFVSD